MKYHINTISHGVSNSWWTDYKYKSERDSTKATSQTTVVFFICANFDSAIDFEFISIYAQWKICMYGLCNFNFRQKLHSQLLG